MSEISDMIQRLCPDGVEYRKLGEVGTFIRGNGLQKKDFVEDGVGCIHYGQIYTHYQTWTSRVISKVPEDLACKLVKVNCGDIVIACTSENIEDVCKAVAWLGNEQIVTGGHSAVYRHHLYPKYVAYFFQTEDFFNQKKKYARGAKVIDIKIDDLAKIEIPVPPLEVQRKIVEVLDNFSELTAELTAELEARKKQYEYYRDNLLNFNRGGQVASDVKWMKLGEICTLSRGKVISKDYLRENAGCYPVYSSQTANNGELGKINTYDYDGQYLTWTTDGAYAGTVFKRKGKFSITNVCGLITLNTKDVNYDYLYYWLSIEAPKYVYKGMGNPKLMSNVMGTILIPIPPLAEQERIVSILDRFEALTTDLTTGLHAEIKARKQQNEYDRETLLTINREN